jgi:hypothetical protein
MSLNKAAVSGAESYWKQVAVKDSKSVFPRHFKLSYTIKSSASSLNSQTMQASFATKLPWQL